MKVLWITNTLFPDVCSELNITTPVVGGWMFSSAVALKLSNPSIELAVAALYDGKNLQKLIIKGITYFLIPGKKTNNTYNPALESLWQEVKNQFNPDVIHIHGTEYPHGLAFLNACGNKNVIISIQGLASIYERYYLAEITEKDLQKSITLRDYFKHDTVFNQRNKLSKRGDYEKQMINSVDHLIGRTSWDKTHLWNINPKANYHFCNETLRNEFYLVNWDIEKCTKHTIFLSQAHYPIKGLHQMIKALPTILKHYPDTKVLVAGNNFFTNKGWRINGYGKYISNLIKVTGVYDRIEFTGVLNEQEMCKKYLNAHVFVCPSSIENSPNSIGEAQLVGTPCVASYVGGMQDMITHGETGLLYRFEEVEMLAWSVCQIFLNDNFSIKLSVNGRIAASSRHDKHENSERLNQIYKTICNR
jgi:glycosyltransferase involved in cell wall biosynthesis